MKPCNPRQEQFCLKYLELGNGREAARQAGYSQKWLSRTVRDLLASRTVQARLEELRKRVGDDERLGVMSIQERKIRLSQMARAKLTDFMELGPDGSWVNIGKETPGSEAIAEIHSRTQYDDDGASPTVYTSVKLHDPMKAIDLLNKMDKIYSDGAQLTVDNRKIEIIVTSEKARELTEKIISGERTQISGESNQSL